MQYRPHSYWAASATAMDMPEFLLRPAAPTTGSSQSLRTRRQRGKSVRAKRSVLHDLRSSSGHRAAVAAWRIQHPGQAVRPAFRRIPTALARVGGASPNTESTDPLVQAQVALNRPA